MHLEPLPPADARRLGLVALVVGSVAAVLAALALFSALPAGPMDIPIVRALEIRSWLPQGWAFFTAPAQAERRYPFVGAGDGWVPASAGPTSTSRNLFGLKRNARLQTIEIEALAEQVHKDAWIACDRSPTACLTSFGEPKVVTNTSRRPTLCGDVGISAERPVPWAWSRLPQTFFMPSHVLRLRVQC